MKAFGSISGGPWALVTVNDIGGGMSTLSHQNGDVVSIEPGGVVSTRPAGTAGPWEVCKIDNGIAVYCGTSECWPFAGREA